MYLLYSSPLFCLRKRPEWRNDFVIMLRWACTRGNTHSEPLLQARHPILTGV